MGTTNKGAIASVLLATALLYTPNTALAGDGDEIPSEERDYAFAPNADLGLASLERHGYLDVELSALIRLGPVRMNFWFPFRFFLSDFSFRTEDYNEARDFLRIPRCVRVDVGDYNTPDDAYDETCAAYGFGQTHDRYYFSARLQPLNLASLGNSETIVSQFRTSQDLDRPQMGLSGDLLLSDWGQGHILIDDVFRPRFMGGHVFLRPPNLLGRNWDETPESVELGFTWAADIDAPHHLVTAFSRPVVDEAGDLLFIRDQVHLVGANALWLQTFGLDDPEAVNFGFLLLADYNAFTDIEDSDALHAAARFVVMKGGWDFRIGAEYRRMGNRYIPSYFDADYSVRSQRFALTSEALALPGVTDQTTLLEYRRSLPPGHRHGFQAWMSLKIPISDRGVLPIRAFVEDATGDGNASASFMVGPVVIGNFMVGAQYLRRNFNSLEQIFALDGTLIRFIGAWYFGAEFDPDSFLHRLILNFQYDRRFFQDTQGAFQQTHDLMLTVGMVGG